MRRFLRRRVRTAGDEPGPTAWLVASISVMLPVAGLVLCVLGGVRLLAPADGAAPGANGGWLLLGLGAAAFVLDILIDFVWAHPAVAESDQPELNQRGAQLKGRVVAVTEPIANGRGKVRVGDTVWPAEGPDCGQGESVRVVAAKSMVLVVEPLSPPSSEG